MPVPSPTGTTPDAAEPWIGEAGEDLLALALGGGGFATVFQLGVVHSLLVSDARPPHVVVGLSAGAVSAAALAEVLQADDAAGAERRPARLAARVARFRELLEVYQRAPEILGRGLLPDPYELRARQTLPPLRLPIHFAEERRLRQQAERERNGLIEILNRLLTVRLTVADATLLTRRWLAFKAAGAEPRRWPRSRARLRNGGALFFLLLRRLPRFASLLRPLAGAAWRALLWRRPGDDYQAAVADHLLSRFHLVDSLTSAYPLRRLLVEAFDPGYFGRLDLEQVLHNALRPGGAETEEGGAVPRRLADYADPAQHRRPIQVVPVAADVASGDLTPLPPSTPLVRSLLAATALVPLLPAVEVTDGERRRFFIDGSNVADEATSALILLLCRRAHPEVGTVRIVPVQYLPVSEPDLADPEREYPGLVEVVARVLELRRFRDATLERRLTEIFSRLLPAGEAKRSIGRFTFLRTALHPVEPPRPLEVLTRLSRAAGVEERRRVLLETVAEGCRSTMESTLQPYLERGPVGTHGASVCRRAIAARLGHAPDLPGQDPRWGPGLAEVCRHCALHRSHRDGDVERPAATLERRAGGDLWEWPRADGRRRAPARPPAVKARQPTPPAVRWPKPQVCLLLSGGVFRGVFQVGVLAAMVEAGLRPRVFAGSSVGSIQAAMSARVLAAADAEPRPGRLADHPAVQRRVADLAATFLGLDHLILSDSFADFVRRLELRGAATRVSPAHLDRLLRRYDEGGGETFGRTTRSTVAGLERLLYLDPLTLGRLVAAARSDDSGALARLLSAQVQKFLDRYDVGQEVLGSGPLRLLIVQHILPPQGRSAPTFGDWPDATLLATATNLDRGRLEVLSPTLPAVLDQGLLASSAFPGVFRPRWSWELFPGVPRVERYVDGGVMDNLPLDAVAEYIEDGAKSGLFARRPRLGGEAVPHLLFTASLESRTPRLDDEQAADLARSWPRLRRRARRLRYNRKLDAFADSQRHFRTLWNEFGDQLDWEPTDLEVVSVKPEWLPGTFAFHPMLGFRLRRQARAIAHGCASTFGVLHRLADEGKGAWLDAWGVDLAQGHALDERAFRVLEVDEVGGLQPKPPVRLTPQRRRAPREEEGEVDGGAPRPDGECWFRRGALCPFARRGGEPGRGEVEAKLMVIYETCGEERTHRAG